jgi:hypothetical protein
LVVVLVVLVVLPFSEAPRMAAPGLFFNGSYNVQVSLRL